MENMDNLQDVNGENEQFPIEPRYHPVNRIARAIFDRLASVKLAMLLLIAILVSCLVGAIFYKQQQAMEVIFGTLWFNGLLVLLVANTACCFFGRLWHRRITVISFGMILFHLSFVAMFIAIVFNSLFYFDGTLRLTEGETLSNRDPKSYDFARHGLFFSYSRLKGETILQQVHRGYKVGGDDKLIAFDVSVADGMSNKNGTIYINNKFVYKGVEYFRDREGYSLLTIVNDRQGREMFGMHMPLQSYKQKDGAFIYGTGTAAAPGPIDFPPEGGKSLFGLQLEYFTDNIKDRKGKVRFQVYPVNRTAGGQAGNHMAGGTPPGSGSGHSGSLPPGAMHGTGGGGKEAGGLPGGAMHLSSGSAGRPVADGTANVAEKFSFGEYQLFVPEVRYWVAMNVRYNPGKPLVLISLWVGLAGMIITTVGRMLKQKR